MSRVPIAITVPTLVIVACSSRSVERRAREAPADAGSGPVFGEVRSLYAVAIQAERPLGVGALAVDAEGIYWSEGASLLSLSPDGDGPRAVLLRPEAEREAWERTRVSGLLAAGDHLYWLEPSFRDAEPGRLMRISRSGGDPVRVSETGTHAGGLTTDGTAIYWVDWSPARRAWTIRRWSADGSAELAWDHAEIAGLAVDGSHVVFAVRGASAPLRRVPREGGEVEVLSGAEDVRGGLAVDASHLYWAGARAVYKMPRTGGSRTVLAEDQDGPSGVVVDERLVVWHNYGPRGRGPHPDYPGQSSVAAVAKTGGPVVVIASDQSWPHDIRLHGDRIYWAVDRGILAADMRPGPP